MIGWNGVGWTVERIQKRNRCTAKGSLLSAETQTWEGSRSDIESILLRCAFGFVNLLNQLNLLNLLHGKRGSGDCWDDVTFRQGFLPFLSSCTALLGCIHTHWIHLTHSSASLTIHNWLLPLYQQRIQFSAGPRGTQLISVKGLDGFGSCSAWFTFFRFFKSPTVLCWGIHRPTA